MVAISEGRRETQALVVARRAERLLSHHNRAPRTQQSVELIPEATEISVDPRAYNSTTDVFTYHPDSNSYVHMRRVTTTKPANMLGLMDRVRTELVPIDPYQ